MNSVLYRISQPYDRKAIDALCALLSHRDFTGAEQGLLKLLDEIMQREYNISDDLETAAAELSTIYTGFNRYYANWARENGVPAEKELDDLHLDIHENILLAHCTDPESMDDLLYEVRNYLASLDGDPSADEAYAHLDAYKRIVSA